MNDIIFLLNEILVETKKTRILVAKLIEANSQKNKNSESVTELEVMTILNVKKIKVKRSSQK